ncbi:MAG: Rpp14/Pop5 family protein [Candidatus Thorarchaeota archaeon]|jgi:RNase P/RNase MRP subunit POP5
MKRIRRRYVRFCLFQDGKRIGEKQLATAIRNSMLSLFGEITVGDSRFFLTDYDSESGIGILQCSGHILERTLAAASLIGTIAGTKVSFHPMKTSGTIKGLG